MSVNEIRLLSEVPSGFTEIEAIFWKLVNKTTLESEIHVSSPGGGKTFISSKFKFYPIAIMSNIVTRYCVYDEHQ